MRMILAVSFINIYKQIMSIETTGPLETYPHPKESFKSKKHNQFSSALKHQNKPRHIRSRVLSRQYK